MADASDARLGAYDVDSRGANGRYLRHLWLRIDGRWLDVPRTLILEGHGLWYPRADEHALNYQHYLVAHRAPPRGANIWDNDYCGAGPNQGSALEVRVQPNANGDDYAPLTGELVQVLNHNRSVDVSIGGWRLRDSTNKWFTLPAGSVLRAGERLNIGVGPAPTPGVTLRWNREQFNMFPDPGSKEYGDGVYLFDKDGDLRAHSIYPCVVCSDWPFASMVSTRWDVGSSGLMSAVITNTSSDTTIDLDGTFLDAHSTYTYTFGSASPLHPGESMFVDVTSEWGVAETRLRRSWYLPGVTPYPESPICLHTFDSLESAGCEAPA